MNNAILISGGVDSSVALRLMQQQGHQLTAFYLKIWLEDELSFLGTCPWEEDLAYVREVCKQANVPLEVISLQEDYWDQVVSYTIAEIKAGRTPNPDILCNQRVKFGAFLRVVNNQFDGVATGHYAQKEERDGKAFLVRAVDDFKDQTYFLSHLNQDQLKRALFPIGHLTKPQVRQLAAEFNLPNMARKDSQGICFLGKLKFADFVRHHLGERTGKLVEWETGKIVGEHKGFWFYTLGQRQGIGLAGGPWYVVSKNVDTNTVFISRNYFSEEKERKSFSISSSNWIPDKESLHPLYVKVRHGQHMIPVKLEELTTDRHRVTLTEQDQALAPGQFAVFYDDRYCFGGGVIEGIQE